MFRCADRTDLYRQLPKDKGKGTITAEYSCVRRSISTREKADRILHVEQRDWVLCGSISTSQAFVANQLSSFYHVRLNEQ